MAWVEKRGGSYLARWYEPGGRAVSKGGFATRQEALAYGRLQEARKIQGDYVPMELRRIPLSEYGRMVLSTSNVTDDTRRQYLSRWEKHIVPHIGNMPIGAVNPMVVRGILEEAPSDAIAWLVKKLLGKVLRQAVMDGLLPRDPTVGITVSYAPKPFHIPTAEEVEAIADAIAYAYRVPVLLLYYGGLRVGELLSLRREDFDLQTGRLVVRHSKTASGRRIVTLPSSVAEELRNYLRVCKVGPGERIVNFSRQALHDALARTCRELGIPRIRPHALRHGDVTALVELGVHPKVIQARAGHSQVGITLDVYAHLQESFDAEAAQRLDDLRKQAQGIVQPLRRRA